MHHYIVELGGFQSWMWFDSGDLKPMHRRQFQQPGHWTLYFLEHDGIVKINNKPIPFKDGNVCFVTPGTKAEFQFVGENTPMYSFTFGLVARTETVAIPAVADLGNATEIRRKEVHDASDWLHISIMKGLAVAFNILWSIAKPYSEVKKSEIVSVAEGYIMKHLSEQISISKMSSELGISHNHLLRLFRDEHQCTIQQYIREMRAEIGTQLITGTNKSVKEISIEVGCPDLQYFNKLIRASSGMSPQKLREFAESRTRH